TTASTRIEQAHRRAPPRFLPGVRIGRLRELSLAGDLPELPAPLSVERSHGTPLTPLPAGLVTTILMMFPAGAVVPAIRYPASFPASSSEHLRRSENRRSRSPATGTHCGRHPARRDRYPVPMPLEPPLSSGNLGRNEPACP